VPGVADGWACFLSGIMDRFAPPSKERIDR